MMLTLCTTGRHRWRKAAPLELRAFSAGEMCAVPSNRPTPISADDVVEDAPHDATPYGRPITCAAEPTESQCGLLPR